MQNTRQLVAGISVRNMPIIEIDLLCQMHGLEFDAKRQIIKVIEIGYTK